jgi:ankyrin repeat protein
MFPNPHDALPLPPSPSLEQYKKRAKDLLKASRSANPDALQIWIADWVKSLGRLSDPRTESSATKVGNPVILSEVAAQRSSDATQSKDPLPASSSNSPKRNSPGWSLPNHWTAQLEVFARQKLSDTPTLTAAQFILARAHGFDSWPQLAKHIESVARANSAVDHFEQAADVIITGDKAALVNLLKKHPDLIRARSTRRHQATLLHYVAANGVENYRQKTPNNIVEIAKLLLDSGADVNATADLYGGSTTLSLVATSAHPERAGVQDALLQLLLAHGATIDPINDDSANSPSLLVNVCLANGRVPAAEFLANHGAKLDLEAAAGLGLLNVVKTFFDNSGTLTSAATTTQKERGFLWACEYGKNETVEFLLSRGVPIQTQANTGQTALHWAVIGQQPETIALLLSRGADLEAKNVYGGTALGQALWSAAHSDSPIDYQKIVDLLKHHGAKS